MKIRSNRTEKHGNGRKSRTPFHPLRYSKITALSAARFSYEWEDGMTEQITHEMAAQALDSLDDCARMNISMDAIGPRGVLERYIAQQAASAAPVVPDAEKQAKG